MLARCTGRSRSRKAAKTIARSAAYVFEAMEDRQLMSSSLTIDGTLNITGSAGNDTIALSRTQDTITLQDNGQTRTFNYSQVRRVVASLGEGHDNFSAGQDIYGSMTILGGNGNDTLAGGGGPDQLQGQEGEDLLFNSASGDIISGGLGTDTVSYAGTSGPVNVTLDNVANDGLRGTSFFKTAEYDNVSSDVENIYSGAFDDYLSAYDAPGVAHKIQGMVGHDYIVGSNNNDALLGYYGNDTIFGHGGNDSIWGEAGSDLLGGGSGFDDLRYDDTMNQRTTPVTIALPRTWETSYKSGQGSAGENDRILGFEAVWGTRFNDMIWGNDGDNWIFGMEGKDFLAGEEGSDRLFGYHGNDALYGGTQNDFLWGERGADYISGGPDWDDVRYDEGNRTTGVTARLPEPGEWASYGNGSAGEADIFANDLEALIGSKFNDVLYGNSQNNYMAGLEGNDFLLARAGNDSIDGGLGNDYLYGEEGDDTLIAKDGAYTDECWGGNGQDTVERDRSTFRVYITGGIRADKVYQAEVIR